MENIYIDFNGEFFIKYFDNLIDFSDDGSCRGYIQLSIYRELQQGMFPNVLDALRFYKDSEIKLLQDHDIIMYKLIGKL